MTRPYFTRADEEQPYYDLDDPRYRNLSLAPYPLAARCASVPIAARAAPVGSGADHPARSGLGHRSRNPLLVGPAISVTSRPPRARFRWAPNRSRSPAPCTAM